MDAANLASELYISDQLETKFNAVRRANDWLDGRVGQLRQELGQTEARIAELRTTSGLTRGVSAALSTEQVSKINNDLVEARNVPGHGRGAAGRGAERRRRCRHDRARRLQPRAATRHRATRRARIWNGSRRRSAPNHPDVRAARSRLQDVDRAVGSETGRVVQALDAAVREARARVRSLEDALRSQEARVNQSQTAEIQVAALEREAEASRTLLRAVLERSQQTVSQTAIEKPDARILSPATMPGSPSFPKTMLMVIAAAVLGVRLRPAGDLVPRTVGQHAALAARRSAPGSACPAWRWCRCSGAACSAATGSRTMWSASR